MSFLAGSDEDSWAWRANYIRTFLERDMAAMVVHPKLGASWEGFALEQAIRLSGAAEEEVFFWGVHNQGEIDLLLIRNGRRHGFEVKYTDRPAVTASQRLALECLRLDRLDIICPGNAQYPLAENVHVTGLDRLQALFGQAED